MTDETGIPPDTNEDLVEIYAAASALEADRVRLILGEDGIHVEVRETSVAGFPSDVSRRHLVVVFGRDAETARAAIAQAIRDEVVSDGGVVLSGDASD